jgi:hypothetical protein
MERTIMQVDNTDVPSYEKFCEMQWNDDSWWMWMVEDAISEAKLMGLYIHDDSIGFDLYHNTCASKGEIDDAQVFTEKHFERLMKVSPVLTQMFKEGMIKFKWGSSRNGVNLEVREYDDYGWWHEDDVFSEGIFAGTSVQELYDLEVNNTDKFEDELLDIVYEWHQDLLLTLRNEDDYRTSTEEYEEWIKEWKAEQNWTPTPSNPSASYAIST